jgi:hypothetical protein
MRNLFHVAMWTIYVERWLLYTKCQVLLLPFVQEYKTSMIYAIHEYILFLYYKTKRELQVYTFVFLFVLLNMLFLVLSSDWSHKKYIHIPSELEFELWTYDA